MAEYIVNTSHSFGYQGDDFAAGVKRERIIRCKDCKHLNRAEMSCRRWAYDNGTICHAAHVKPDGFCDWGELDD